MRGPPLPEVPGHGSRGEGGRAGAKLDGARHGRQRQDGRARAGGPTELTAALCLLPVRPSHAPHTTIIAGWRKVRAYKKLRALQRRAWEGGNRPRLHPFGFGYEFGRVSGKSFGHLEVWQ